MFLVVNIVSGCCLYLFLCLIICCYDKHAICLICTHDYSCTKISVKRSVSDCELSKMRYSKAEKIDMVYVYAECRQILREAIRCYTQRFPGRAIPSRSVYTNIIKNFEQTGSVNNKIRKRSKSITNERNTVNITAAVTQNPHVSTRQLARESGISQRSILRILHVNKSSAFHISLHQELHGNDFQNRVNFCEWGLRKLQNDERFLTKVLFSDEASFTNCGQVNRHNMHYWSVDNPRWLREVDKQRPWSVNVWCGLINNEIIGPYFIDGTLNSQKYEHMLTEILPQLLENIPLQIRQIMWFQQDGCPVHSAQRITEFLNVTYGDRWIGRAGNHKWPARSPDLTPLDFYLWGKLKEQVYSEAPTTREDMKERIRRACAAIDLTEIQNAVLSVSERFRACINVQGHHFEHLY